jgi:histidinol-phosphate aminotransferase
MNPTTLRPSPAAEAVRPYRPPRPPTDLRLKLDANEGAAPPEALLEAVRTAGAEAVRRYPDEVPLQRALARRLGVPEGQVLVTAGGDDALGRALAAVVAPGREAVLLDPTFEMLPRYVALAGGTTVRVPWREGPLPVDALAGAVTERTAVIGVVSPNSPTGLAATGDELRALARRAPGVLLLLDGAYAEYADEDLTAAALALPDAVVVRTLSKAWGLAGLRIGYAVGPERVLGWMRAVGHPYAVSSPSLAIATAWLAQGEQAMAAHVARVRTERGQLAAWFHARGAGPVPSQANFLLVRVEGAERVWRALGERGIAVRWFPGTPGLEDCLRITMPGDEAAYDLLVGALEEVLG